MDHNFILYLVLIFTVVAVNSLMLNKINQKLQQIKTLILRPHLSYDLLYSKKGDFKMLVYNVTAGSVTDSDVVERRLSVSVNGQNVDTKVFPGDATSLGELSFNDNDNVVLTLTDVDDAGNVSSPAIVEFVAIDTIPPAKPGEFGVTLAREE